MALATGGSRGLGLQMGEVLRELGAKVAITARKIGELEEARDHLKAMGIVAVPLVCDMSDPNAIPAMVAQVIAACGPIDILVNNAGTSWSAPTIDQTLDGWNKVITLNPSAIFVACQEVGRHCMVPRSQGKVINIASVQGISGAIQKTCRPWLTTPARAGVVNFTRTLANEWAAHAIAPGYFKAR